MELLIVVWPFRDRKSNDARCLLSNLHDRARSRFGSDWRTDTHDAIFEKNACFGCDPLAPETGEAHMGHSLVRAFAETDDIA